MSKKVKILIAVGIAVVLITIGIAIPVLAADTPTPTPPVALAKSDGILERTAKILGIPKETLLNAENQARQELCQQPKGTTPTPRSPDDFYNRVAQIIGNGMTRDKLVAAMQQAAKEISNEVMANQLAQAVTSGKITQDDANQIKDWVAKRPSALDKLFGFRGFGGMMGRGGFPGFGGPGCGGPGFRGGYFPNGLTPTPTN